jgi:hypothetical protein
MYGCMQKARHAEAKPKHLACMTKSRRSQRSERDASASLLHDNRIIG